MFLYRGRRDGVSRHNVLFRLHHYVDSTDSARFSVRSGHALDRLTIVAFGHDKVILEVRADGGQIELDGNA